MHFHSCSYALRSSSLPLWLSVNISMCLNRGVNFLLYLPYHCESSHIHKDLHSVSSKILYLLHSTINHSIVFYTEKNNLTPTNCPVSSCVVFSNCMHREVICCSFKNLIRINANRSPLFQAVGQQISMQNRRDLDPLAAGRTRCLVHCSKSACTSELCSC